MKLNAFASLLSSVIFLAVTSSPAADYSDGPAVSSDESAHLGDVFAFLDPNDNSQVVLSMTVRRFIVPGEAVN